MKRFLQFLGVVLCATLLAACNQQAPAQTAKMDQAAKAAAAANSIVFTDNAEIDNIKKRIELTSKPGLVGYVVLLNQAGQPIAYHGVQGKITSGGKRLTSPETVKRFDPGGSSPYVYEKVQAPSDEGTYGSSGDYIFFWTTNGEYIQWNGGYYYSDKPIRLRVEPLVVTVTAGAK